MSVSCPLGQLSSVGSDMSLPCQLGTNLIHSKIWYKYPRFMGDFLKRIRMFSFPNATQITCSVGFPFSSHAEAPFLRLAFSKWPLIHTFILALSTFFPFPYTSWSFSSHREKRFEKLLRKDQSTVAWGRGNACRKQVTFTSSQITII